ncbi:MAG TPA: DUF4097 family beta strand repeat-containing protein [Gemmatimonadaceae bacterium]|jgi:hypothetical protein
MCFVAVAVASVVGPLTEDNLRAQVATSDGPVLGARRASPTISIKAWNPAGSIRFIGWDKDSVVMRGRVGHNVRLEFSGQSNAPKVDGLKLGVEGHWTDGDAQPSDLVVYMPRGGRVAVRTVSADISANGVSGYFYTVSGNIRMSGQAASIEAETMNGSLDMNVATPWMKVRAGDGNLLLRGQPQDVDASTVAGTLSIATSTILRGQFASVTGDIHFVGDPPSHAILDFSSHSGTLDLLLPQSASAMLALSSITGAIENGFSRVRPTALTTQSIRLSLGRGDAQVTARTFKGPIRLRAQ